MAEPPVLIGAVKATEADPVPAVAVPIEGAAEGVAYPNVGAFVSDLLLFGVSVTGPTAVGVIENVCAVAELLNVSKMGVESPPPEGVTMTVPL